MRKHEQVLNPSLVEEVIHYRQILEEFCRYPLPLVSDNEKTQVSLNLFHGGEWDPRYPKIVYNRLVQEAKHLSPRGLAMQRFKVALDPFLEEYGYPTIGSCIDCDCRFCFGEPNMETGKPMGYCYGNQGYFIVGLVFFQNYMRFVYFDLYPEIAFHQLRLEVEVLRQVGKISEKKPFRWAGIGDMRQAWVKHFIQEFADMRLEVSGFTRDIDVFLLLQMRGFVRFALSTDKSLLECPDDIETLRNNTPYWASIVYGPTTDQNEINAVEATGIPLRTLFRRHQHGIYSKFALQFRCDQNLECPSIYQKMILKNMHQKGELTDAQYKQMKKQVSVCFAGCNKCHAVNNRLIERVRKMSLPTDSLMD